MTVLAELVADSAVEGVYAVARKERLRTRAGASYLALELTDESGRIAARVWNDVDLLDTRFSEGEAVRVLGRVESFRDKLRERPRNRGVEGQCLEGTNVGHGKERTNRLLTRLD